MKHPAPIEDLLQAYEDLLAAWAPRFDLIAPGDLSRIRDRHIDDSLRALPLVQSLPDGPCADVGSGAGLPGLPLAIASQRPWRLLEPRRKRAAFLEEAVRQLALDQCEVLALTAEQAAADPVLGAAHVGVTARALAPPRRALQLCLPLAKRGGVVILFAGANSKKPSETEEVAPGLLTIRRDAH